MNGYTLTKDWYNYKFENPDKVRHIHSDLYFYIIDRWNRLGQKEKFGLPTLITMEALNIKSRKTYYKAISEIESFGFIKEISASKNQNTSRIISLSACVNKLQAHDQADTQTSTQTDTHIIELKNKEINKGLLEINAEWKEALCMSNSIKLPELNKHLKTFILNNIGDGGITRPELKFRGHFTHWLPLQDLNSKSNIPFFPDPVN